MKNLFIAFVALFSAKLIFAQPVITSFTPTKGPVGTAVTISGAGFSTTTANNIVYFGAVKATVTAASANSLTVLAPAGATYQPITVTVGGLIGASRLSYSITFPSGNLFNLQSFGTPITFLVGESPYGVVIGDFNVDGKSDIATTNFVSATVSILKNISIGDSIIFAPKIDIISQPDPYDIATGDLNGDGKLDIIVSNINQSSISYFINTSSGGNISFAARVDRTTGNGPKNVHCSDIDGDGKMDIIVVNTQSNNISILRNTSSGGNVSFAANVNFTPTCNIHTIALSDFDGDGKVDIAGFEAAYQCSKYFIIRNTSNPGVINLSPEIDISTSFGGANSPNSIQVADFNNDGKNDFAFTPQGNLSTVVFNNSTVGNFIFSTSSNPLWQSDYIEHNAVGDINGDGFIDNSISTAESGLFNITGATKTFIDENSQLNFTNVYENMPNVVNEISQPAYFKHIAIGDLNGDGKPESVRAASVNGRVAIVKTSSSQAPISYLSPLLLHQVVIH